MDIVFIYRIYRCRRVFMPSAVADGGIYFFFFICIDFVICINQCDILGVPSCQTFAKIHTGAFEKCFLLLVVSWRIVSVDCLGTSSLLLSFLSNLDGSVWLVLYRNRRGSASVDVLACAKRSCGVRNVVEN